MRAARHVATRNDGGVSIVDVASKAVGRLDLAPNAVLVRPDGAVAFAALRGDHRVAVIDLETLEVVSEIPTGPGSGPGCMFRLAGS